MLIKCRECNREISDSATACPGCGAPTRPTPAFRAPDRPSSGVGKGCGLLVALVVLIIFIASVERSGSSSGSSSAPAIAATPTPRDTGKDQLVTMGSLAVASLKAALRDPDSMVVENVSVSEDSKYACVRYRARNGFGGLDRDHVVFTTAGGDQSARGWNRHCTGSGLVDVTRAATLIGQQVAS